MMLFWNSASVAAHAMLKRMFQNDEVTKVFQVYFSAGCCDIRNLSDPFARLDYIKDYCTLFKCFTCENEAFAHTPSLVAHPQLCILVYWPSLGRRHV